MSKNKSYQCIKLPSRYNCFEIGKVYEGYIGWYDADSGETELRIYVNNICRTFRDYEWTLYFKEL